MWTKSRILHKLKQYELCSACKYTSIKTETVHAQYKATNFAIDIKVMHFICLLYTSCELCYLKQVVVKVDLY